MVLMLYKYLFPSAFPCRLFFYFPIFCVHVSGAIEWFFATAMFIADITRDTSLGLRAGAAAIINHWSSHRRRPGE